MLYGLNSLSTFKITKFLKVAIQSTSDQNTTNLRSVISKHDVKCYDMGFDYSLSWRCGKIEKSEAGKRIYNDMKGSKS